MESKLIAPHHGHAHAQEEVDPHGTGLRAAIEGEEKHHDEKPAVLKKVKEKVKKIKNKMSKKKPDDEKSSSEEEEEVEEEEDGYKEDDEPEISSAPTVKPQTEPEKVQLGDVTGDVKEDPAAPRSTNPPPRGGEEIGTTPVIQAFESMAVSEEPKPEPKPETETETEPSDTGSTDHPNVSYTEKLKSMATVPAEYSKHVASTVYDKLSYAGTAVVRKIRGGGEPAREGGTGAETSRVVNQDKGVSVKEYISEKLKPGEEDQALSEVISEAMERSKEEIERKAREEMETVQTKAGGVRVVEKIRGAVSSVVGSGKGSDASVASDMHQEKGSHEVAGPKNMEE